MSSQTDQVVDATRRQKVDSTTASFNSIISSTSNSQKAISTTKIAAAKSPSSSDADVEAKGAVSAAEQPKAKFWSKARGYCIIIACIGFIFGWDVGTIGGVTNMVSFKQKFGSFKDDTWTMNALTVGLIIAVFNAGAAIGGLTLAKSADKWGRKAGLMLALVIYNVGLIIQETSTFGSAWFQFMIGRIVTGYAIGATSVIAPMFIGESAPISDRGGMIVYYQLAITFGILMGNITNYGVKEGMSGDNQWMLPVWFCHIVSVAIFVGVCFMPESAAYYISKNKQAEAAQTIATLNNIIVDHEYVIAEVGLMIENHNQTVNAQQGSSWHEVFTGRPKNFRRLLIGVGVMFFQQFGGANYFFYYGTTLFASAGLSDSYITAIVLGAVNFVATFAASWIVEALGRRSTLLFGSVGMFICMIIYTCLGSFALSDGDGGDKTLVGGFMIGFTCIYIIFFATTWGPGAFVVVSELYNIRSRAMAMAIATAFNWMSNFLISLFTPYVTKSIGYKLGFVFSGCLLASVAFVWVLVPETKGLRVEQVDKLFAEKDDK